MINKYKLVQGWGVYDVETPYSQTVKFGDRNKKVMCPYFSKWRSMILRAKCPRLKTRNPSYKEVTICNDWQYFSQWKKFVDSQPNKDWTNCEPDKDLLLRGNKIYSPDTVVFISKTLNRFLTDSGMSRGSLMLGVTDSSHRSNINKFCAYCGNPFTKKGEYLGYFPTEIEAHLAWKAKKHEHACRFAREQDDPKVAEALINRYSSDSCWDK